MSARQFALSGSSASLGSSHGNSKPQAATDQSFIAAFDSIAFARCNDEWEEIEELHRIRAQKQIEQSALHKKLQEVGTLLLANSHEIAAVDERIAKAQATIRGREHQTQGQLRSLLAEWESSKLSQTVINEKELERRHAKEVATLRRDLQDALSAKKSLEREVAEVRNLHERQMLAMQSLERPAAEALLIGAGYADRESAGSTPVNHPLAPTAAGGPSPPQPIPRQQSSASAAQSRLSSFAAGSAASPNHGGTGTRTIDLDRPASSAVDSTTASINLSQYLDGGRGGGSSKPGSMMGLTSPVSASNLRPTSQSGTSESSGSTPSSAKRFGATAQPRDVPDSIREMVVGPSLYREERLHHSTAPTPNDRAHHITFGSLDRPSLEPDSRHTRSSPTTALSAAPRSPQQEPIVPLHALARLGFEVVLHNREGHPAGVSGVAVAHVQDGGPAWAAGLRENDVIQAWGATKVKTVADLKTGMEKSGSLPRVQVAALIQPSPADGLGERLGPPRMLVLRGR